MKVGDFLILKEKARADTTFPGEVTGLVIGITGAPGMYMDYAVMWMDGSIEDDLIEDYLLRYYEIYPCSC